MIAQSSKPKPAIESNAPAGSGRSAAGFFESGTSARAPTKPATAMGTLTMKMEPHQNLARSKPPAIGPTAMPSPMVPAQPPMARARSAGSRKMSLMIDNDEGIVSAAPPPMTARHAISKGTEPANAAPTEAPAKTVRPMRKNLLRLNRSARLPPTSNSPAKTMAYESTIHCSALEVACSCLTRVGRATLRMVLSTLMIKAEAHTTANAAQR